MKRSTSIRTIATGIAIGAWIVCAPTRAVAQTQTSPANNVQSTDSIEFQVGGFTQVDYLHRQISVDELSDGVSQGNRRPLNENRFLVRHARIRLSGDWQYIGLRSETELFSETSGSQLAVARPVVLDAHAQLPSARTGRPWLQLKVGLFEVPFTFESFQQSDTQRHFGERSLFVQSYVPGRFDLGVALNGHIGPFSWIVAMQNGEPIGAETYAYRDPNSAKDYSGRVTFGGDIYSGIGASLGLSGLKGTGFHPGTPPTKDSFEWRDLNEDGRVTLSELIPVAATSGRPSQNFERWGAAADSQAWVDIPRLGRFTAFVEAAVGENLDRGIAPADPVLLGRSQRGFGWYTALTQNIGNLATVGARFERYDPNLDQLQLYDGITVNTRHRFETLTSSVSTHLVLSGQVRARLLAEYEWQKNTLGRNTQGLPDHLNNNTIRVRAEVRF